MEENNENQNNQTQQEQPQQTQQVNQNYQQQSYLQPKKTNPYGLASFICALVGLLVAGLPLGTAALVTGIMGITRFNPEKETNKWMAVTGLVLGIIDIICVIYFLTVVNSTGFFNKLY